jgi:chromosome partitioning protein
MRPSSLVAQLDEDGVERFRVTRPIDFDLDQAALAMHAIVDPELRRRYSRGIVGKSRVPMVLRTIARDGWPTEFQPHADRVRYWKSWLVEHDVFSAMTPIEGEIEPMDIPVDVETRYPRHPGAGHRCSVLNQKGGVGKTAVSAGVSGALAERGRRVLLVDLDPQGHLTTEALGLEEVDPGKPNIAKMLTREYAGSVADLSVTHSELPNGGRVDIIPTSPEMFLVIANMYKGRGRRLEWTLDEILSTLDPSAYDHIIIDCPPALDILTDNALVASHGVLIPVQPARTSLRALGLLLDQITVLEAELKLEPRELLGMVLSLYRRPMSGYAKYVTPKLEDFSQPEDPTVTPLPILAHMPLAAAVEEAWLQGRTVVDYAPKSPQANALRRLAVRLDVAAGLAGPAEWDALPPLPSLAPAVEARSEPGLPSEAGANHR